MSVWRWFYLSSTWPIFLRLLRVRLIPKSTPLGLDVTVYCFTSQKHFVSRNQQCQGTEVSVHVVIMFFCTGYIELLFCVCVVYIERLHRPGNKLILVHSIQLPELSISKARMSWQLC